MMAETTVTAIDAAWRAAQEAHGAGLTSEEAARRQDHAAAAFIDALLSEQLYCPVWDAEGSNEESIAPKMVERDGADTLVVFDSEERMQAFAQEPTEYVSLQGAAYFKLVAGEEVQIALNPDVAPSATLFRAETVDAIAELAEAAEEEVEISADAPLTVLPPDEAPETLTRALAARLAAARGLVVEAWLFTAVHPIDEEAEAEHGDDEEALGRALEDVEEMRQLIIGLTSTTPRRASDLQDLAAELDRIGAAAAKAPFGVALFEPEDRLLSVARSVGRNLAGDQPASA